MKEFTTTELKNEMATVYNSVFSDGKVKIKHRDRPDMILITKEELESLIGFAQKSGYKVA